MTTWLEDAAAGTVPDSVEGGIHVAPLAPICWGEPRAQSSGRAENTPRTLSESDEWFSSEAACVEFLRRVRWPAGFGCPRCNSTGGWVMQKGLWRCASCVHETSITAGTIFAGTRKPLRLWFQAA